MAYPFGPWQPDAAGVDSGFLVEARNVYPTQIGYAPVPSISLYGATALPSRCIGMTFARTATGGWVVFAGTTTNLYKLISGVWVDVSRLAGGVYGVPTDEYWSFAQFGTKLIAVNFTDDPQVIDVDSGTNFAALAGSPPKARYVGVVGDFVFLAALTSNPRVVRNSAINNSTGWTIGVDLCDEQEFADGGRITGFASGEFGYLTQEKAVRQAIFQPGSDIAFRYERVEQERGCSAGYGLVSAARVIFYPSDDGFYAFNGQQLLPIGSQRINKWFRDNSDTSRYFSVLGFTDPYGPRIYWAFYATSASTNFDRLIIYDWKLDRWSYANITAQFWGTFATPGTTLEQLDVYGSLDTGVPFSLDSRVWEGGRPVIGAVNANGELGFLEGAFPLDALITTSEMHLGGGQRVKVNDGVYPQGIWNDATVNVRVGRREHTKAVQSFTSAITPSTQTGWARMIASGRVHQFEFALTQSSGMVWKHAQGFDVGYVPDGRQ